MTPIADDHTKIIRNLRPDAKETRALISGEMNDMIVVDEKEIFRFPRTAESCQRLEYESRVLGALNNSLTAPIPSLVYFDSAQNFSVLSYIDGDTISSADIQAFSSEQKDALAVQLARSMQELNAKLSVKMLQQWTVELMHEAESWDAYYERIARRTELNEYHQRYVAQYEKVTALRAHEPDVPNIAIHGDLHAGNMVFNGTKLAGIIDFGDCEAGSIYNELRPLYSLGHDIMERVIAQLGDELGQVNIDLVREWAIMHELSVLARSDKDDMQDSRIKIAQGLLSEWQHEQTIKAIIFDCFGVLTSEQWIPFRRRHFHTDDARHFAQRMMTALVMGKIAQGEFITTIAEKGNVDEDDVRESLSGSQPDTELFSWISEHKDNYKISMLSNAGSNMLGSLFNKEQIAWFDDIVLSFEVGLAKPDPNIFRLAAERLSLKPEECLFVDDKVSFCNAAERTGMKSIHYTDYEQFVTSLGTMQS